MKGDGALFQRGGVWWADYRARGRRIRESLHTTDREEASKKLQRLRRARDAGTLLAPPQRKATVNKLLDDLQLHLEVRGAVSASKIKSHLVAVRGELGELKATELDTAAVERYQKGRLTAGKAAATINRECEALRQAFRLASRRTPPRIVSVPHIPLLKVDNARQGFIARADFAALLKALTDADVRDFIEWFWWTGMRPNEIRQLTWEMINQETKVLHLDPKAAKTRYGRAIALEGPLGKIIERRKARRRLDTPLVFHRTSRGEAGQPVKDIRLQWLAALKTAGLPQTLRPYDLRRSALRNMVRGGTDVTVVMKISGHRTRSTFDRYNITAEEDIRAAIARTAAYVETLPKRRKLSLIRRKN